MAAASIALAACTPAANETVPPPGYDFPRLTGRVVDAAHILAPATREDLARTSEALEQRTGHQFVVVTVLSLKLHSIADYGNQLGNYWGIGRSNVNDGVLLIVAPTEKEVRIEVGRGLEKALTDREAWWIIRDSIIPKFKAGDLDGGVRGGADGIVHEIGPVQAHGA